ncbi:MAG: hypothetical protein LBL54_04820 [Clostridiales Family XIII bacterium]|nr:hypothetical protein [Clostridiales Family XIII bacterium]
MKNISNKQWAVTAILVFVLVVALASCGAKGKQMPGDAVSNGEAYALYKSAVEALNQSGGYEADMVVTLRPADGGLAANADTKSHIKVNAPRGDVEMKRTQTVNAYGVKTESTLYIKDGALYTDAHGQKAKLAIDRNALASRANSIVDFPKGAIEYESMLDVYGGKQVFFTMKGSAVADYVRNQLNGLEHNGSATNADSSFKEGRITAIINPEGNLTECTMEVSFNMRMGESKAAVVQKSVVSNIKPGKTEIDFPADLGSYKEFDI